MASVADTGSAEGLPEGFEVYYNTTIEPELDRFDKKRRNGGRLMVLFGVVALLGLIATVWLNNKNIGGTAVVVICVAGVVLAILGLVLSYQYMRKITKTALVEPTCRFLGYEYTHKPSGFPVKRFYDLKLIRRHRESSTHTEDLITGMHNGLPFQLCEVEIKDKRDNEEKKKNDKGILFRGLLFICEFPHDFSGETRVLHSVDRTLLPKTAADGSALESVYLEESQFSQSFHIYSSDQVEARYVLNPSFMERLMDLVAHFNPMPDLSEEAAEIEQSWLYQKMMKLANSVSVAFVDNQMLISIRTNDDRFEGGSVFKSLNDRQRVEKLLVELQVVPEILDTLALEEK